ncbi:NADPH-dependent diflavin oxidoreductase 1 isoform X1 [Amaranthus tricolor]|uniref:NADPH-dependent diflavin oxidoreductase 1 isoform X1 n=1 Tax=Amaranthus tricolor TaxID=29722 RepID=UPI00258E7DFF|nr:NADPH-dependent diflavin oxidoreductase 1 isoform X1 [Amaranthus tricolor]XP_057524501.1 NADPH-dependent diflavin oxidoreductase 1 isoform X1 [Amaranthus tricolor]
MEEKLLILYATQTGNAMDAAERIGREADRRGFLSSLFSIDQFDPSSLCDQRFVIFVVSTTGQGDTPDSMKVFWRYLLQRHLTPNWLGGVNYAVFGLGDSGYQKYNFVAKKLDKRLSDLGGTPIIERGLGDDQHPSGYEGSLDPWMSSLWNTLNRINPNLLPNGVDFVLPDMKLMDQPKVVVTYHVNNTKSPIFSATPDLDSRTLQIQSARMMSTANFPEDKSKPHCWLKMTRNFSLTRAGCGRDVRHIEFEFHFTVVEFEVGDVLEILPTQNPDAVEAFIQRCNLDPEAFITVQVRNINNATANDTNTIPIRLKTFVELTMDIASASPRRYFFEVMSYFATAEHEKERLQYFASPEGRDDLYQYNQKERRTVLEVLEDFPSVQMPFEWLVQLVPPLKTRAFSISSSPAAHPNEVHLTVSVVSWMTPFKRKRYGLCSKWLAELDPQQGILIPVWFQKGLLPAPSLSLPLILIGPGTGCAPFRGFVAERAIQSQYGPTAPVLFFFGCRNKDDFLYSDFWLLHSQDGGVLSEEKGGGFYVAFSRDQPQKVYVQHKMQEHRHKVWDLLSKGASVYVAGSSTKMPSDVLSTFEEIVSTESEVSKEAAVRWLRALEKAGRYHVEAWS